MTRRAAAIRFAVYYAAMFAAVGINLPFWPVWLADRGLTAAQIGVVVSVTYLCRVALNPVVGAIVDRRGDRRRPMTLLMAGAAATWTLFAFAHGFPAILALSFVTVGLWAAMMPIGESLAMMASAQWQLDYGRVRLWGSAAFILCATFGGRLLLYMPPAMLVWPIAGALAATAFACHRLPDLRAPAGSRAAPALRPLLTSPAFLLFLASASLNQAAHTVYYAFATLHWRAAGIADDTIGLLWSEGVLAEIVLFSVSGPVVRRLGPARLLLAAGAAGVVRWLLLASFTQVPVLAAAQVLHAATFGCAHLGAMHFLQRAVPASSGVRAQGLFGAVAMGAVPGLMSPLSGSLYQHLSGGAFAVMAVLSVGCALAAFLLARVWRGGAVE